VTLTAILALGFVLGMRHALDADHLAAVATLASRCRRRCGFRSGSRKYGNMGE
jgi:high-affinity nickel permease